jgi:23S rRNA U2552 (ribose-2'-O)-methylase RlmE/FtsJ
MDKKHVLKAVNAFVDLHAAPGENEQLVVNVSGAIGGDVDV